MQVFGYFDLTSKKMLNAVRGNTTGQVAIPTLIAGEALRFNIRFRETRDGSSREINPNVRAMKASLGRVDVPAENGKFKLIVNGETTAFIEITGEDDEDVVTKIKSALAGLNAFTDADVAVEEREGSYIVTFPNDETTEQTITVTSNRLYPRSFVRVRNYERGDRWEHELRTVQAPVAFTSTYERENGPVPLVNALRDGGEVDDEAWSEIQSVYIPPQFPGTFRLTKDQKRSDPISPKSTVDQISAAIERLADAGGEFKVTNPVDFHVYVEFGGDMTGTNYADLGVEIFDGPEADYVVVLDSKTREMADIMQATNQEILVLEIHAELEDPDDAGVFTWHNLYRRQVGFREAVDWDELATAPQIDWLNPPTFTSYRPFSPDQVSNGQIHYTTEVGDGVATVFSMPHGLDTDTIQVFVTENSSPGASFQEGTHYTWVRNNANQITLTWLGTAPDEAGLLVTVLGLAQTSFFDPHTHEIDDVNGLREWMTGMEDRVSQLEKATGGTISTEADEGAEIARWRLPRLFELYPSRVSPTAPDSGLLSDVDLNELDENGQAIIKRGRGLLPAIHDPTVEALPIPVPSSELTDYTGKVFQNQSEETLLVSTGLGNRSRRVKPDEYVGCDGRGFYPVAKHDNFEAQTISIETSESGTLWSFTGESPAMLPEGKEVQVASTGTLPAGSSSGTTYTLSGPDFAAKTFELKNSDGDVITLTNDGSGEHTLLIPGKTTFYSRHYERTLFEIPINADQLRYRTELEVAIAFELAVLKTNTKAQWAIMFEIGEVRSENSEGSENDNLKEIVWQRIPTLERVLHLTSASTTHRFGLRIKRRLLEGVDTFTAQSLIYGALENGLVPPNSANFLLRARLGKFDTEDGEPDPKGLVMASGLDIQPLDSSEKTNIEYGYAVIA